jgi:hypothetical protein
MPASATAAQALAAPKDGDMKEYIVTLGSMSEAARFYQDMEMPGGPLYIPNRSVECAARRPISRNTHYMLTDAEAEMIKHDGRVLAVELSPREQGLEFHPMITYKQSGAIWDKSGTVNTAHPNWGLLRSVEGVHRSSWGSDGTATVSADVVRYNTGKHVDVVIVDGTIDPEHPEFAVNEDGTGGSRVIQYNWFQHNPAVKNTTAGTYNYGSYYDGADTARTDNNNHGHHVAGIACGARHGWAREANIYNFDPYSTNINGDQSGYIMDYIREFHKNKPVNPETGRKNPTITNNSYGYSTILTTSGTTAWGYRGNVYTATDNVTYGVFYGGMVIFVVGGSNAIYFPVRSAATDADMVDAMNDGIICVAAAGNSYHLCDVPGGVDYDNYVVHNGSTYYHSRGTSPGAAEGVICVGSASVGVTEKKAQYSCTGPRVDIFAPGDNILSAVTVASEGTADDRNATYGVGMMGGTSMASPQVTGVLACALSQYPNMTQSEAMEFATTLSTKDQLTSVGTWGGTPFGDIAGYPWTEDLQNAPNRYLYLVKTRLDEGVNHPKARHKLRPTAGAVFPRTTRVRYG